MMARIVMANGRATLRLLEPQTDKGDPTGAVLLEAATADIWLVLQQNRWVWTSNGPFAPRYWTKRS